MPSILDIYKQLITALDSILLPTQREGKHASEEYLKDLYNIAQDMIKFKNLYGNLQHNYGQGALIEKFSEHFYATELPQEVKNSYQNFFQNLDIQYQDTTYENIALEYNLHMNCYNRKIENETKSFFAHGSFIEKDQTSTPANQGKHASYIKQRRAYTAGCNIF